MERDKQFQTCIISPSGNLYGSEQVLLDFLRNTNNNYLVYCPSNSNFYQLLSQEKKQHTIVPFKSVIALYINIYFLLLLNKIKVVYINEGGHVRYVKALASLFPSKRFLVHIRIVEDTTSERLGKLSQNIKLISISKFIQETLYSKVRCTSEMIYDLYSVRSIESPGFSITNSDVVSIGFVGRVTKTKGLEKIVSFLEHINTHYPYTFHIHFFGEINKEDSFTDKAVNSIIALKHVKVNFHGFVKEQKEIYSKTDIVVHLSEIEALGRIFFEALDHHTFFVGINKGGIGEIAEVLGLTDYMINDKQGWQQELCNKIFEIVEPNSLAGQRYSKAVDRLKVIFATDKYVNSIDGLLKGNI